LQATDSVDPAGSNFFVGINESGQAAVIVSTPSSIFVASIIESLTATDSVTARLFWEPIDDDQTISWVAVNDDQPSSWTQVDDSQNPAWTEITTV
jgi:hypothetical protein